MMINKIKDTEKKIDYLKERGKNIKSSLDEISELLNNMVPQNNL